MIDLAERRLRELDRRARSGRESGSVAVRIHYQQGEPKVIDVATDFRER